MELHLTQIAGSLILIVLAIVALGWFFKRLNPSQFDSSGIISKQAAFSVGLKEKIMLVKIEGKSMLIGITAHNITPLHVFEKPILPTESNTNPKTASFSTLLNKKLSG